VIKTDDAGFTPATDKVAMIGAQFDDAATDSVDEGDAGAVRMSGNRNLYVRVRDNAGNERGLNIDANGALAATVTNATAANLNMTEASAASILTSVQLIDDLVYTDDTSTHSTGSSKGALIMAAATPTDGSVNANDIGAVAMTTDRKLHVSVQDALPAGTNAIGKLAANSGVDIGDVDITSVVTGTGATNLGKAEDAAHTTGDVGVMALGVRASSPTERSAGPTDGDYEPFGTNEVGAVWVTVTPSANGGASTLNSTSSDGGTALTNSAQAIKASAGTLKGYYIYNPNSSAQFVQFYNTASGSVTVGTTNPLFMLTIPATSAANLWMTDGIAFGTAMSWSATSTAGGNGAPSTALDAVAWYK